MLRTEDNQNQIIHDNDYTQIYNLTPSDIAYTAHLASSKVSPLELLQISSPSSKNDMVYEALQDNEIQTSQSSQISSLTGQVIIGMARDLVWGISTHNNTDLFKGKLGAFWGNTLTQLGLSTIPTIAIAPMSYILQTKCFGVNKYESFKEQSVFVLSSLSAIPIWNGAQLIGNIIGEKIGLSPSSSGYFAGIFTGVAESLWQNALVIPGLLQQQRQYGEITFGILNGAVWQWVLQANDCQNIANNVFPESILNMTGEDVLVGNEIASAVALTTVSTAVLAWKLKRVISNYTNNRDTLFKHHITPEENQSCLQPEDASNPGYGSNKPDLVINI